MPNVESGDVTLICNEMRQVAAFLASQFGGLGEQGVVELDRCLHIERLPQSQPTVKASSPAQRENRRRARKQILVSRKVPGQMCIVERPG